MIPLPLDELAAACSGQLTFPGSAETVVSRVSTDTRSLIPGSLFVALKGDRFNGHAYLGEAARRGAVAAVVSEDLPGAPLPLLRVTDTLAALGLIAGRVRQASAVRTLGITGSVGKTTTKEMAALILASRFSVLKSEKNENNEIGVPLTLLKLEPHHEVAVVEMGMRGPGEIEWLSRMVKPDAALITNIGVSHIGRLGSREAIAEAKAEIFSGMAAGGAAILNRDDAFFSRLARRVSSFISFGFDQGADVRAEDIRDRGLLGAAFRCQMGAAAVEVKLGRGGTHLIVDSLAALAAGVSMGVPLAEGAAALASFAASEGRGAIQLTKTGAAVVDDAYNASPDSMAASLKLLTNTPGFARRMAVLGDMLEMGDHAEEGHRRVGREAAASGIKSLVCVGPESRVMAEEARCCGMPANSVTWYATSSDAAQDAAAWSANIDLILVKGSNGTRMSVIVAALVEGS